MNTNYINTYATSGAVQTALDNGELLKPYVAYVADTQEIDWNTKEPPIDYSQLPFTIEILSDGDLYLNTTNVDYDYAQFTISINGAESSIRLNNKITYSVTTGDIITLKGNNSTIGNVGASALIGSTCQFKVYGNIMSLISADNFTGITQINREYMFYNLFGINNYSSNQLIDAGNLVLPATTLASKCYYMMFNGCTSLTTAPELPATTLANYCYADMFNGCTSLTKAPELPATTLITKCYYEMFYNCSSLNYIKCLATDVSAPDCVGYWVKNVSGSGTFVTPQGTSWFSGWSGIPSNWTRVNA